MGYIIKNDGTILKKKKKEEEKNKVLTIKPFTYSDNNTNNFITEDSFERKKSNDSWFDAGAFSKDSGLGFFELPTDVAKTILGTGANVASGVLKGVSDVGFGTGKLVAGGVAQVADWAGQDEWANKVRNRIAGKDEKTNKRLKAIDVFGNINEATQDASVLGKTGNEVIKSIGQIAGYGAASVVNPALGSAAMFGSSAGESLGEAYSKENVTNEQAWTKALVGGGISLATERLFGLFGKSGLDTAVANKISSKLTSGMGKELARLGVQATSEATEELLEYAGNQLLDLGIDAVSQGKGAKFHKDWNWEEVGQQMAIAAVASGIVGAGTKAIGIRNTQGSNLQEKINNYALQEDIQEGVLPQQESPLEKLQRTNIEQRQQINQQVEQELATRRNGINQELSLPTVSTEGMNLMESASRYNIKPETQSAVQNLMENRGIESRWDATRFNDNSVNALWTKDANGNRQVIFNPNASLDTIVEEVAVHELTHDILSSKNTTLNSQEVLNYVKTLQGYNEARQSLENTYATMYDPNSAEFNSLIDEEVVADVLGRKLGNQEFINQLVNSKPSVAKSIYNWVVNKLNSIVNKGKVRSEKLYWQNIKNNFENAYKQEYKNNEMASTKYKVNDINTDTQTKEKYQKMLVDIRNNGDDAFLDKFREEINKKMPNFFNKNTNDMGVKLTKEQQEYFKNSKARGINDSLKTVFHTMTNSGTQFNEFNPVGTDYYKFGDQTVNYYTDSKEMSGSYANQVYKMADTTKFNNIDEVKNWLKEQKTLFDEYDIKPTLKEGAYFLTENGQAKILFETEDKLLKNVKQKFYEYKKQFGLDKGYAKYQYEGYVNITNPYIVDAEERNWNQVISESNDFIDELDERIPQNVKDNLTRLYRESENKSSDLRTEYDLARKYIDEVDRYLETNKETAKIKHLATRLGYDTIDKINSGITENLGVSTYYNLAEVLEQQGVIGKDTAKLIIDDFIIPEQVQNWINKNYNKKLKVKDLGVEINLIRKRYNVDKISIADLFDAEQKAYIDFDKYRMPSDYFIEQISSEGNNYLGNELEDMFETRAEIKGADAVGEEIAQAASVGFSKPEMIRLWGTSKTTNDIVKEVIASNNDGTTNYDGVIIQNVYDYGGKSENKSAQDLYITFNSNQFKAVDNTTPTEDADIRYSKQSEEWDKWNNKTIAPEGTKTKLGDIKLPTRQKVSLPTKSTTEAKTSPTEPKKTISKSTLTQTETKELNDLKMIDEAIGLDSEEEARMKFLEKKQQGYVERYSGLKKITDFKEISREYGKYKDLSDFNDKLLKDAEKTIQGYRNTGRRTKAEWLDIAKNIGSNYKGNSEGLTKYAIQSWFEAQPNQKDTLNRQGDKYVDFKIQEWVNAVYDGARIGELEKPLVPTTQQPKKETTSIPMVKNNESLRVESQRIANEINKNETFKQKGWLRTAMGSDVLKDSGLIKDLDPSQLNYVVQSNKSSVDKANNTINTLGYEKSLDKVKQIINDDKLPSASDVALMQRMIQEAAKRGDAATVQDLIMDTAIVGTDLGQATQALSIIQRLTPEGQLKLYTKLVQRAKIRGEKSFQNVEITPEMVENVLGAYNSDGTYNQDDLNARVEQLKQDLANQMKSTIGDKTNAWRYLAMLGNPKTHIRNIVSNLAMNGTIKVKNAMARTLETILPVEERTKTWKPASQDVKEFARQTTKNMKDIITGEAKYNEKSAIESKKQIFKNKALEKLSNFNGNALEAEDWFFSSRAFQSTLQEYLTANGINTYEDIQNNPEIVEKAKNYAKDQAEIATFRQYSKLAATINQIEKKNKGAKLAVQALMPFKKTPINVAKAGVKYSPLGLAKTLIYDGLVQLRQGNIEASQFIDNLSQGLTGTSLTLLGYALAKAGFLNGSGGDDKDDKYDSQLGNTGYSLNIGGNSYSISWLSPVAMPLLVGSNFYEQLEEDKDWDMNVVSDTLAKTLDPLNEMSFMQGLTNALQSYGSGADKIKGSLESTAQNYVGQFFPTIFSQLASTLDDKKRSTKASNDSKYKFGEQTVRSIMYKIPGLRQKLEAATDIWGNEKEQSDNIIERAFESFIAPYSKTKQIETDLDKEIKRVYNETGETGVIPGIPNSYVKYKNETYRMSANEYTDYKKTYGQNANKYLNNLIDSNSYKTASDKVKAKMINNVYNYAKAEANEQYFKKNNVDYTSDELKELEALREEGITGKQLANYVADKTQISSIKSDNDLSSEEKKNKVLDIFENSDLNNDQLSYLYSGYYSTEEKVRAINNVNIPIKEFIKYDLQDFESDYNVNNGKAVSNSKKAKVINYINNNLKLSAAQKALLIKLEYNTFKGYDNQIVNYIKSSNAPFIDKAYLLKRAGFDNFDKEIINYVQSHIKTAKDKEEILKNMGFTVRNGRVYK